MRLERDLFPIVMASRLIDQPRALAMMRHARSVYSTVGVANGTLGHSIIISLRGDH